MFNSACQLSHRSLVFLRGGDRFNFLQPLISNDLDRVEKGGVIWAAHLTPQGKFSYDLLIGSFGDVIILEVQSLYVREFLEILQGFKLRDDIELALGDEFKVWSLPANFLPQEQTIFGYGLAFTDVRSEKLGHRFWGRDEDFLVLRESYPIEVCDSDNEYHSKRIELFVPENSQESRDDLIRGKTLLLEAGFDSLGGIDWEKGCYVGQELTARTKYRGLVKRCLVVAVSACDFASDEVHDAGHNIVGDLRSRGFANGKHIAMAGMRLNDWDKDLFCAGERLEIIVPDFVSKPLAL